MAFPRNLLADHEKLILDLRPHWIALAIPAAIVLAVLVAIRVVFGVFSADNVVFSTVRWVAVVAGVVIVLIFAVRKIVAWATDNFVVTSDRLIHRQGLIAKKSMEIPLEAINDVRFDMSILGRVIGEGTLTIHSAAEASAQRFAHIRRPEAVQKTIYEAGEQNHHRMGTAGTMGGESADAAPITVPSSASAADEIRKLHSLRAEGLITDEEFESQKARLLGTSAPPPAPAATPEATIPSPPDPQ